MLMEYILEKLTVEHYPHIEPQKCLQLNLSSNKCTKCKDTCSKAAIKLESDAISFNKNLCNSCGICRAACPTQAINMGGLGEENILRTIKDKDNIIFSCSKKGGKGTLKLTCLHAFHPELLAALFIMHEDKLFYFNTSRCKNCEIVMDNSSLFFESLTKAESFVKSIGINPKYEIIFDEENLNNLSEKSISRRDLFSLFRKESSNVATNVVDTIVSDKDSYLSIRKILLDGIQGKSDLPKHNLIGNKSLLRTWNINNSCNGCGNCKTTCPYEAWKIEKKEGKLNIYHNAGKCYQCGKCVTKCSQNAIEEGNLAVGDLYIYSLKKQVLLTKCCSCSKDFMPINDEKQCPICDKKEALRNKLASI